MTPHVHQPLASDRERIAALPWVVERCLGANDEARFRGSIEGLRALARSDGALALRLAMNLAWIKRQDLMDLGYPGFRAFVQERVDLCDSYVRGLVRLVESDLERVKRALCTGVLSIRDAIRAPGAADEMGFIAEHAFGDEEVPWNLRRVDSFPLGEEDAEVVRKARRLARLLMGREATDRQVDAQMLVWFREQVPGEALVAAAREPSPRPSWERPLSWDWLEEDPAEVLLGPWAEPASLEEAMVRIDEVQAVRRGRMIVLAKAWALIKHERIYECAGYDTAGSFVREVLDISPRTASRWFQAGWTMTWYPEVEEAVREGLPIQKVAAFSDVVHARLSVLRWLAVAKRVGTKELARAAREGLWDEKVVARYERAIELADAWDQEQRAAAAEEGGVMEEEAGRSSVGTAAEVEGRTGGAAQAGSGGTAAQAGSGGTAAAAAAEGRSSVGTAGHEGPSGGPSVGTAGEEGPSGGPSVGTTGAAAAEGRSSVGTAGEEGPSGGPSGGTAAAGPPGGAAEAAAGPAGGAAPLFVALPWPEVEPGPPRPVCAPPEVVEAARWLLETVQIPAQRGFGRVKERDGFRCTNPECRLRTLKLHAHHTHERAQGGSDELENGTGACPSCHLRGIHTRRIGVRQVEVAGLDAMLWTLPGRRVLSFREVPMV